MSGVIKLLILATGCLAFSLALPVAAQQQDQANAVCPSAKATIGDGTVTGFVDGLPRPPCQEPALPPASPKPIFSESNEFPGPAGPPTKPDFSVASTELGFASGIGPATGYAIAYQGKRYLVVEVKSADGGPSFSGGSRFTIGAKGASLIVGLAAIPSGKAIAGGPAVAANVLN